MSSALGSSSARSDSNKADRSSDEVYTTPPSHTPEASLRYPSNGSHAPAQRSNLSSSVLQSRADGNVSRPASTVISSKPPPTDAFRDTLPELQPIFTFLNSQANKLYHEGYFLKLNDLDNCMLLRDYLYSSLDA